MRYQCIADVVPMQCSCRVHAVFDDVRNKIPYEVPNEIPIEITNEILNIIIVIQSSGVLSILS